MGKLLVALLFCQLSFAQLTGGGGPGGGGGGSSPSGSVNAIQTYATSTSLGNVPAPTTCGFPYWNGSAWSMSGITTGLLAGLVWNSGTCTIDYVPSVIPNLINAQTPTNYWDFGAAITRPNRIVTGAPPYGTCDSTTVGQTRTRSDAQAVAASLYSCNQTGVGVYTWELVQSSGSGGGQTLSTGFADCLFPCWGQPINPASGGPSQSQSLAVAAYRVPNAFASRTMKQFVTLGFSGNGKTTVGVYDSSCALIQQSNTVSNSGGYSLIVYTLSTPAVVTTPWFYVAFTFEDSSTFTILDDAGSSHSVLDGLTNVGLAYAFTTHATQVGGAGTTITMPSTCGGTTRITGAGGVPPFVGWATN